MNNYFKELGLSDKVLTSIEKLNFEKPSKIQELLIPLIMEGKDLIGQAQTGTGKTLAYASSILSKIDVNTNLVKAIILVPTRELAIQVSEEFLTLNTSSRFNILSVYGGSSIEKQINELNRGVDIVVGTPGRVMDLLRRKKLNIEHLEFFVLDEADEMLNMGFLEDIELIFKSTNDKKQVLMLSATMPSEIKKLASNYMKNFEHIKVDAVSKTADNVMQYYYLVDERVRNEVLCRVLDLKDSKRTIIFCQTKKECDDLLTDLSNRGYDVEAMHGDIVQAMRIQVLERFKQGVFKILIATDVAARGIHVDNIDLVINYRLPQEFESYIHRIGRTARAGNIGEAISLVNNRELKELKQIEKFVNSNIIYCEVPSDIEIKKMKYNNILEQIDNENEEALEYVRDLNKGDLINLSASLLKMLVSKELGSNFNKSIEVKERVKKVSENTTRVFITIGKKENLKKGSLLDYLKEETKIRKENFNNIEILSTFTFIDVNSDVVDEFINKIYNKKYKNRIIRAEKAKRQK